MMQGFFSFCTNELWNTYKRRGGKNSKSWRLTVCACIFTMLFMLEPSYYLLQKSSCSFPLSGRNLLHPIWGLHPDDLQSNKASFA